MKSTLNTGYIQGFSYISCPSDLFELISHDFPPSLIQPLSLAYLFLAYRGPEKKQQALNGMTIM